MNKKNVCEYRIKVISSNRAPINRQQNIALPQLTAPVGAKTRDKILDADTVLAPLQHKSKTYAVACLLRSVQRRLLHLA
jgi:hypothetical protein